MLHAKRRRQRSFATCPACPKSGHVFDDDTEPFRWLRPAIRRGPHENKLLLQAGGVATASKI
jgi:hypothetical protein